MLTIFLLEIMLNLRKYWETCLYLGSSKLPTVVLIKFWHSFSSHFSLFNYYLLLWRTSKYQGTVTYTLTEQWVPSIKMLISALCLWPCLLLKSIALISNTSMMNDFPCRKWGAAQHPQSLPITYTHGKLSQKCNTCNFERFWNLKLDSLKCGSLAY